MWILWRWWYNHISILHAAINRRHVCWCGPVQKWLSPTERSPSTGCSHKLISLGLKVHLKMEDSYYFAMFKMEKSFFTMFKAEDSYFVMFKTEDSYFAMFKMEDSYSLILWCSKWRTRNSQCDSIIWEKLCPKKLGSGHAWKEDNHKLQGSFSSLYDSVIGV